MKRVARTVVTAATAGLAAGLGLPLGATPARADGVSVTPNPAHRGQWVIVATERCHGEARARSAAFKGEVVDLGTDGVGPVRVASHASIETFRVTVTCSLPRRPLRGRLVVAGRGHRRHHVRTGPETGGGGMAAPGAPADRPTGGRHAYAALGGALLAGGTVAGLGVGLRRRRTRRRES